MVENSYIFKSRNSLKMIFKKWLLFVLTYNRIIKYLIGGLLYGNIHKVNLFDGAVDISI